jgi:hypothetical protein
MKTSNKLLIGLAAIFLLALIAIMTTIRSYASKPFANKGDRKEFTRTHTEPIIATQFDLGHNNRYFLDSEMEGIKINGPKYAVQEIQYSNGSSLAFTYSDTTNANQKELKITIGTKNLPIEKIAVNGNALCESDRYPYPITNITVGGNATLRKFYVASSEVSITIGGNAKATIQADADQINTTVQGNSDLYFKNESIINRMDVNVGGNASVDAEKLNYLSGRVGGNAKLDVDNVMKEGNVKTSGNGRDRSNYPN